MELGWKPAISIEALVKEMLGADLVLAKREKLYSQIDDHIKWVI